MQFIEQLKRLLSYRTTSYIVILVSLSARVIQKLLVITVGTDKSFQVQATKNLLEGNGISIREVYATDLSIIHHVPVIKWPPGYSLLLSPFYAASSDNFLWGTLWLDIIASILFVWLARKIFLQFEVPKYLVNIYTLVTGFFLYDFFPADSSDLLALVFFQAGLLFTLKFLKPETKKNKSAIWIVLSLYVCCSLRYMYIPVVLVLPAYVIVAGILNANKVFVKRGIQMLTGLAVLIGCLLLFQKMSGGSATYLYPIEKGFYPENLLETFPYLYTTVAGSALPALLMNQIAVADDGAFTRFFIYTHLVLLGLFFLWLFKWAIKKKGRASGLYDHYTYLFFLSSFAVIAILFYLSLAYTRLPLGNGLFWTYVSEPRYFAAPVFLFQLWLFLTVYHAYKSKKLSRGLAILILLPVFISSLHAVLYTGKKIAGGNKNFFQRQGLVDLESCRRLFHQFVVGNPGKNIVCASGDPMFNNFASLWEGVPGLYDYQQLNNLPLKSSKPTVVFVAVKDWYAKSLDTFMNNPGKKFVGQVNEWIFYSIDVGSDSK